MPVRFEIYIVYEWRYVNTLSFLSFPFSSRIGELERELADQWKRKGNEEYLYSAIYYKGIVSKCSDMDRTILPANYTWENDR